MPRNKTRKTDRGMFVAETMRKAVEQVIFENKSLRTTAKDYEISRTTLTRYVDDARKYKTEDIDKVTFKKTCVTTQVFTYEEEQQLSDYIIKCSKMFHGLSAHSSRKLAWEYAQKLGKKYPESWNENCNAGREWFFGLMKRNTSLSLRMPEATSLARASAFNPYNVQLFYDQYEELIKRSKFNFEPHRIWNLDETGVKTVQGATKVVSQKGLKQVGQICSTERGVLVTMCCCVNASGMSLPPAYIFPRVNFKDHMLNGAPSGSCGLAAQSGWMNNDLFQSTLKHFIKHMNVSKDNPAILLMDNHESHVTLDVIDLARENGLMILSFPPHCSHRMQPLDVSVYGPFKKYYNSACNDWMLNNPGKHITIYDVAALSSQAYYKAFIPGNIIPGFNKTGLVPYNRNLFTEDMFLPSQVRHSSSSSIEGEPVVASVSGQSINNQQQVISPEVIRPYPQSSVEKVNGQKRTAKKSTILTDTPEREKLYTLRMEKLNKKTKAPVKRKLIEDDDSSSNASDTSPCLSSSSDDEVFDEEESGFQDKTPEVGDYIIVRYDIGNNTLHYVGIIIKNGDGNGVFEVKFFRRSKKHTMSCAFIEPTVEDTDNITRSNIVAILPQPIKMNTTKRQQGIIRFEVCLDDYNIE